MNQIKTILSPVKPDLWRISTWADMIKNTPSYQWSKSIHYINPEATPPLHCADSFYTTNKFNIISAISNYTTILSDDASSIPDKQEAIRFLVHLFGDFEQPLHCTIALVSN
jgi:hypothetical protein